MPIKTPSVRSSLTAPVLTFLNLTAVTARFPLSFLPRISSTTEFQAKEIFGLRPAFSCMILDARSESRLWTIVTFVANLVRYVASSIAVSPPPTTTTSRPLKKNPSHVAHAETPKPKYSLSDGKPSSFAEAPVATMTASAVCSSSSLHTRNGRVRKSTRVTGAKSGWAPNRWACWRITSMRSGPIIPWGNPGKFSTSVVIVNCPPGWIPSNTTGVRLARAA